MFARFGAQPTTQSAPTLFAGMETVSFKAGIPPAAAPHCVSNPAAVTRPV